MCKHYSTKRDWYECKKCKNQGFVKHGKSPDPNKWGGCSCEGKKFSVPHEWEKLVDYQNIETWFEKYPEQYFDIE